MGIMHTGADFLIRSKVEGVRFDKTLTLGRQAMFVSPVQLVKMLKAGGIWRPDTNLDEFYASLFGSPYRAEGFFRYLGATTLDSMDYAPYEGATVIHDLNQPIPDSLKNTYDAVLDIGTLEHVFNFPVAIKNCMEMVKVGGHFIAITPANGYFGHGFYQFSAELYFRLLSAENGYEMEKIYLCDNDQMVSGLLRRPIVVERRGGFFQAKDPAEVRQRVLYSARRPIFMFVRGRRVADIPVLQKPALQSDYVAAWGDENAAAPKWTQGYSARWVKLKHLQLHRLPMLLRWLDPLLGWRSRRSRSFANRAHYKHVR